MSTIASIFRSAGRTGLAAWFITQDIFLMLFASATSACSTVTHFSIAFCLMNHKPSSSPVLETRALAVANFDLFFTESRSP
jgi:hypothetical protein